MGFVNVNYEVIKLSLEMSFHQPISKIISKVLCFLVRLHDSFILNPIIQICEDNWANHNHMRRKVGKNDNKNQTFPLFGSLLQWISSFLFSCENKIRCLFNISFEMKWNFNVIQEKVNRNLDVGGNRQREI